MLYARAGETVTCENGHEIVDLDCDAYIGDIPSVEKHFKNWRNCEPPTAGDSFEVCVCFCGGRYLKYVPQRGAVAHIGDNWREGSADLSGYYNH